MCMSEFNKGPLRKCVFISKLDVSEKYITSTTLRMYVEFSLFYITECLVMKIRRTGQGDDVVERFENDGDDDMIKMIKPLIWRVLAMVLVVMVMMIVVMLTATISTTS